MMNNYGRKKSILQKLICASLAGMMLVTSIIPAMAQTTDGGSSVLDSIEITSMPTKNEYLAGETLDPAGLEVTAHYTGGKEDKVLTEEEYLLQTPDMSAAGTKTVTVSYEEAEITKEATFEISVAQESEPAEESTAEVQKNEPAEDATPEAQEVEPVTVAPISDTDAYELSLSADSVSGDADYINLVSQTTGILSVSANLPLGETGRYIDIYLPDYGFALGSPLPSTDGNITNVERLTRTVNVSGTEQTVEGLRLRIADSVDSTLNIQVPYTTKRIGARLDIAWGLAGTLPATGFEVTIYNGGNTPLATQEYGNWVPENVEDTSSVTLSHTPPRAYSNTPDGYHISNFPSLGNYTTNGGSYRIQLSINNAYYSDEYGNTYIKETPYKLKVYVPDPSQIEVTNITASGLSSFDADEIQTDGENWWYELEFTSWTNNSLTDTNSTYGSYGLGTSTGTAISSDIYIYMRKVEGSEIQPGTEFQVKPLELITRAYGENDLRTHTVEWTPRMRQVRDYSAPEVKDNFQYRYYGGTLIAPSGNGGATSTAWLVEPGTSGNTSRVGFQNSGIDYRAYSYRTLNADGFNSNSYYMYDFMLPTLSGSSEEWTFPYEVQPTGFTYVIQYLNGTSSSTNNFGNISTTLGVSDLSEILEVSYQTSDGGNHIASLSYGGSYNRELYVNFDAIPEGKRVVSVNTTWKNWVEAFSYLDVDLNYNVASTHEDGTAIEGEDMFQVEHVWKNEDGEVITDSKEIQNYYTHIWFAARPQRCPGIYWVNGNSFSLDIMNNEDRYVSASILKVPDTTQNTDASSFRDTMSDPQLKLGMLISTYGGDGSTTGWAGNVQTDTQFLTGKMTVMPFLAGWTVKYSTVNKGDREYVIPEDIPEEGLEIEIPLDEGDRFNKIIVFTKEGEVSGWSDYPELITNIEYAYWRDTMDSAADFERASGGIYSSRLYAYLCFSDCDGTYGNHMGTDDIYGTANCYSVSNLNPTGFVYKVVYEIGDLDTDTSNTFVNVEDSYQGTETVLDIQATNYSNLQGNNNANASNGRYVIDLVKELYGSNPGNNASFAYGIPYETRPVFYVELKNPELVYMGASVNTEFGYLPRVSTTSGVDYIETADGGVWLKITPDEIAEYIGNDNADYFNGCSTWSIDTSLFTFPGAATGNFPAIGEVYMDLHVEEMTSRFDGNDEEYPYLEYRFSGLVADTRGLLGDDDTTPLLYRIKSDDTNTTIYQRILSGVSLVPGSMDGGLATETRVVDVYNHDADGLRTLVSIGSANENLTDYEAVIEIPKEGKQIRGTQVDSTSEETVVSQFDMRLTQAPEIASNSSGSVPKFSYRLVDSAEWIGEDKVTDWGQVDAIKVNLEKLDALSALNLNLYMEMDSQTEDGVSSYIGGTYSYLSSSSQRSSGVTMLGEYVFRTYKISGHVWYDPNENGTKSGTAETAMEGITIEVKRTADDSVVATTETNTEGNYSFELLEGEGLYLELTLPDGYKLTRQSESDHTVSANDSDFIRTTNRFNLPTVLRNGTYTNLSAGLVKLPVLTAPDISVMAGETANPTVSAQWDYGRATIHYEEALDTTYASVASDGTVSGNQEGTTTATVWVENRLGDRVEETYKITVLSQSVSFTLTKQLTKAAEADETFIFMIQDADSVFYTTLTVAKGSTAASITVEGMAPGSYTVTELDSNWRFKNTGTPSQTQQLSDHNADYSFTFTNEQTTSQWLSGNANVVNKMAPQNP